MVVVRTGCVGGCKVVVVMVVADLVWWWKWF